MIIGLAKKHREDVVRLLSVEKLQVIDLPEILDNFLISTENGQITGVIGLETYGNYGLLRSLVVMPGYRNKGIAGKLIERLESLAALNGLKALYLLTETAPDYFESKGFQKIARSEAPEEIQQSTEFAHVCPVSAIVMKKNIN